MHALSSEEIAKSQNGKLISLHSNVLFIFDRGRFHDEKHTH